jgi:phosphoesterase RecJ-like protein
MIQHLFNKATNVLVITHVDPDGDAMGSLTAVGQALKQDGKQVTLVCDDRVPERFAYLPMTEQVRQTPDPRIYYDLLVAVDCGDEGRMGEVYANFSQPLPTIVNIDHHITNTRFGDIQVIDDKATSTTEILYGLLLELGYEMTPEIALSLLTGLVTDTLGFRTVGVTAKTMKVASALMDAGADLAFVTTNALTVKPLTTIRLWQVGLNGLNVEDGVAWVAIPLADQMAIGFKGQSSMGLVNLLADVDEVGIGTVLMEIEGGRIRVGFRSRPPYNVAAIAEKMGGGGHVLAAGCTLEEPLAEATARVVALCKQAIRQQAGMAEAVFAD